MAKEPTIHEQSRTLLNQFQQAHWFHAVGQTATPDVRVVASWTDAIAHCAASEWESVQLEAANAIRAQLPRPQLQQWNTHAQALRPSVQTLVQQHVLAAVPVQPLPQVVCDVVQWDVLHALIEAAYTNVRPPDFYARLAAWYLAGRFPCGWDGAFPQGTLIIY